MIFREKMWLEVLKKRDWLCCDMNYIILKSGFVVLLTKTVP